MTITTTLAGWASTLRLADVPDRVVDCARTQILSQVGSIRAGLRHPSGRRLTAAFGMPLESDARAGSYVLAALSIGLDYDDTAFAGHLSHSTVNVPLAYALHMGLTGEELLIAVVAANECAARITAAATIGPFRGQSAAHTHLVGAVAGRLRAEKAPASMWVSAWGLALALPLWPLDRGFYGSDAKFLVAAAPVRLGLDACDAAQHGLLGADDIVEHPLGFLPRFADVPLPELAVDGLGQRWHTETFSYKVHPGSAYMGGAIAAAADLHPELAGLDVGEIAEVLVEGSLFTVGLDRLGGTFAAGPDAPLSALNFSLGYSTATALLTGDLTPADFAEPGLRDPARWELAGKVRVQHDAAYSRAAMFATAPLGAALRQAGDRAESWVRRHAGPDGAQMLSRLGGPAATFENSTKRMGARVTVRFTDGRELVSSRDAAPGSVGSGSADERHQLVRAKFDATGGNPWAADSIDKLETLSATELDAVLRSALDAGPGV